MSKLGKKGQNWHYGNCFKSLKDKIANSCLPQVKMPKKREMENFEIDSSHF